MATFGQTNTATTDQQDGGGIIRGSKFNLSVRGTISSISLYCKDVNAGTVKITFAIYSDDGSNTPVTKKITSVEVSTTSTSDGWVTANVTPNVNIPSGNYWIVWTNDGGTGTGGLWWGNTVLASGVAFVGNTYPTLPTSFGAPSYQNFEASIYATYTPGGSGEGVFLFNELC